MKTESQLYAYRRHLRRCPFFGPGGREARTDKCNCPFHVDGLHDGRRIRESLKTRSRQHAERRPSDLIRSLDASAAVVASIEHTEPSGTSALSVLPQRTILEAVERFLATKGRIAEDGKYSGDAEHGTWRKYRGKLNLLVAFCSSQRICRLIDVSVELL